VFFTEDLGLNFGFVEFLSEIIVFVGIPRLARSTACAGFERLGI